MNPSSPLLAPFEGPRFRPRNRVVFGPHETNLGEGRGISARHVSYYRRRAAGGCGTVVVETASVHRSDWPYERAPLASECGPGWAEISRVLHDEGALCVASLGHAGGQGSSAYSQLPLWSPSGFPDPVTREVPLVMEDEEIAALLEGFAASARAAVDAGADGVEVNAGQHSLLRQFLSGVTNSRADHYGRDRPLLAQEVLRAVRAAVGDRRVVGIRLACDELAPWAGITPDAAPGLAVRLAEVADYVVAVRAPAFDAGGTRPDGHTEPGFALPLARAVRAVLAEGVGVVAQGSIVDVPMAEEAVAAGSCDLVEMTRAQIAEPRVVGLVARGIPERIRPCVLCNQRCCVRDARNPIVSCIGEPSAGYESEDPELPDPLIPSSPDPRQRTPDPRQRTPDPRQRTPDPLGSASPPPPAPTPGVLVVGAGPAGLEAARVAALGGHAVTVVERTQSPGGQLVVAARGAGRDRLGLLARWLVQECTALGVAFELGVEATTARVAAHRTGGGQVVVCTGGVPAPDERPSDGSVALLSARELLASADPPGSLGGVLGPGAPTRGGVEVVVDDQVGDAVGISVAELVAAAGHLVVLVTGDQVAGTSLARTGDLAPANARLARAGVEIVRRSVVRAVREGAVEVEDRFSGRTRQIPAGVLVVAGYAVPGPGPGLGDDNGLAGAGDAVAPRSVYEAVLEGRRAALALGRSSSIPGPDFSGPSGERP